MVALQFALWTFSIATLASVALWGSRPARLAAGIILLNFVGSTMVQSIFFKGVQIGILALDVAMFVGLYALAHRVRLWWTRAVAGFAAIAVLIHVSAASSASIGLLEYVGVGWVASTLIIVALLISLPEGRKARLLDRWAAEAS
jgi:hypothetical protein